MGAKDPKLKTVNKNPPPFPLNKFPKDFPYKLGKEIIYLLASKGKPILKGEEWESIFADCIGAEWNPSNVGLDDVRMGNTAWGAKTVYQAKPSLVSKLRLISGRNSIVYSYGEKIDTAADPEGIGPLVLGIWNKRVTGIREKYENLRTVVLIKSKTLSEVVVFEFDTNRFLPELYTWKWNQEKNLIGIDKASGEMRFTWQPHGSQFTIIEDVPPNSLVIRLRKPEPLNHSKVLEDIGFDNTWITVIEKKEDDKK